MSSDPVLVVTEEAGTASDVTAKTELGVPPNSRLVTYTPLDTLIHNSSRSNYENQSHLVFSDPE